MDILYDMPRPKPATPLKPVLLKLPGHVVDALDADRKDVSRAAYVAGLIMGAKVMREAPAIKKVLEAVAKPAGPERSAIVTRAVAEVRSKRRIIGFDPKTGEPIYG